jgi:hypothetical protein
MHENLPMVPQENGKAMQNAIDKLTESRVVLGILPL